MKNETATAAISTTLVRTMNGFHEYGIEGIAKLDHVHVAVDIKNGQQFSVHLTGGRILKAVWHETLETSLCEFAATNALLRDLQGQGLLGFAPKPQHIEDIDGRNPKFTDPMKAVEYGALFASAEFSEEALEKLEYLEKYRGTRVKIEASHFDRNPLHGWFELLFKVTFPTEPGEEAHWSHFFARALTRLSSAEVSDTAQAASEATDVRTKAGELLLAAVTAKLRFWDIFAELETTLAGKGGFSDRANDAVGELINIHAAGAPSQEPYGLVITEEHVSDLLATVEKHPLKEAA